MSANLDNRLAFIQASRRGVNFEALQKQEEDRRKEKIIAIANQLGGVLANRQDDAAQKVDGLIQEVLTSQPLLESEEHNLDALNKRMEGLKAVQQLSVFRNANTRVDWEQRNSEMQEVLQKLAELKTTIK